jgi:hypothetical protein
VKRKDAAYAAIQAWENYQRRLAQNEAEAANGSTPDAASLDADRHDLAQSISDLLGATE